MLVIGVIACLAEVVQMIYHISQFSCTTSICGKELMVLVFILPSAMYIISIIGQYDDRLQAKQKQCKEEKENLTRSYNDLLADMDGLLLKSSESSAGLAERSFESKRRDFQRFLERAKQRYTSMYTGSKAESDRMLEQFKRFCVNWLQVFEECSIDPIQCPKRVVTKEELDRQRSIAEVADLCLERLRVTEVRFISIQRDQDTQLLRKNRNVLKDIAEGEVKRKTILINRDMPGLPMTNGTSPTASSSSRRLSWIQIGGQKECGFRNSPTDDGFPKELCFGCGRIVFLSTQHVKLIIGCLAGAFLIGYEIFDASRSKIPRSYSSIIQCAIAEAALIVMLLCFEELDVIQQLEREVKELVRQNEQIEKQRGKMQEFWSHAQQLTELWLYRTVPRLDLYKEVHSLLEDASQEELLMHISGANQALEELDTQLGALEAWRTDGAIPPEHKKVFGKAINALCQEQELCNVLEKLEDVIHSKMPKQQALPAPSQPPTSTFPSTFSVRSFK